MMIAGFRIGNRLRGAVVAALLGLLPVLAAGQDAPPAGLLWNRSGLPATFPLQVRAPQGVEAALLLYPADQDRATVAGFVRGGQAFRLLVPPGDYTLRFVQGEDWQGPDALFGPDARWTEPVDLAFHLTGPASRQGQLVTLELGKDGLRVGDARPQDWCQIPSWNRETQGWPDSDATADLLFGATPSPRERVYGQDQTAGSLLFGKDPTGLSGLRSLDQSFDIRSRPCD